MEEHVHGFHHPHIDMFDALWKEVPKDPSMIDSPATASVTPPPHKPQPAPMDPEFMEIFKAMQAELKELRLTVSGFTIPPWHLRWSRMELLWQCFNIIVRHLSH